MQESYVYVNFFIELGLIFFCEISRLTQPIFKAHERDTSHLLRNNGVWERDFLCSCISCFVCSLVYYNKRILRPKNKSTKNKVHHRELIEYTSYSYCWFT
jgi:hypothetical protein